jgi:hypothetical protein
MRKRLTAVDLYTPPFFFFIFNKGADMAPGTDADADADALEEETLAALQSGVWRCDMRAAYRLLDVHGAPAVVTSAIVSVIVENLSEDDRPRCMLGLLQSMLQRLKPCTASTVVTATHIKIAANSDLIKTLRTLLNAVTPTARVALITQKIVDRAVRDGNDGVLLSLLQVLSRKNALQRVPAIISHFLALPPKNGFDLAESMEATLGAVNTAHSGMAAGLITQAHIDTAVNAGSTAPLQVLLREAGRPSLIAQWHVEHMALMPAPWTMLVTTLETLLDMQKKGSQLPPEIDFGIVPMSRRLREFVNEYSQDAASRSAILKNETMKRLQASARRSVASNRLHAKRTVARGLLAKQRAQTAQLDPDNPYGFAVRNAPRFRRMAAGV